MANVVKLLSKHGVRVFSRPSLTQENPPREAEEKCFEELQSLANTNNSGRTFQQSLLKRTEKEMSFESELVSNDKKLSAACTSLIQTINNENPLLKNACLEISKKHEMWEKSTSDYHGKLHTTVVHPLRSILSGHPHLDVSRAVYDYKTKRSEVASQRTEVKKRASKLNSDVKHKEENAVKLKEAEQRLAILVQTLQRMGSTSRALIKTANREQQISILAFLVDFAQAKAEYHKQTSELFEQMSVEIRALGNQCDSWSSSVSKDLDTFGSFSRDHLINPTPPENENHKLGEIDHDHQIRQEAGEELHVSGPHHGMEPISFSVPFSYQHTNGYQLHNAPRSHSFSAMHMRSQSGSSQPLQTQASSLSNMNDMSHSHSQGNSTATLEWIHQASFSKPQKSEAESLRETSIDCNSEIDSVDENNEIFRSQDLSVYNSNLLSNSPYVPYYSTGTRENESQIALPGISEELKVSPNLDKESDQSDSDKHSIGSSEKWELSGNLIRSFPSDRSEYSTHSRDSKSTAQTKKSKKSKVSKQSKDSATLDDLTSDLQRANGSGTLQDEENHPIQREKLHVGQENPQNVRNKEDDLAPNDLQFYQSQPHPKSPTSGIGVVDRSNRDEKVESLNQTVEKYMAVHHFHAKSVEEIDLNPGDRVMVYEKSDSTGWFRGHVVESNEVGWFPGLFVKKV